MNMHFPRTTIVLIAVCSVAFFSFYGGGSEAPVPGGKLAVAAGRSAGRPGRGPKPVVIGYVGGFRGLVSADSIDVAKLSIINYAFVDIKGVQAWLHNEATDTINLRKLVELKRQKPALKILISIGGWSWSKLFSNAVLTDSTRAVFAASAVDIVGRYKLDGVDIDWEYPGLIGDSNVYRPEDKENYTLMFKSLRNKLDSLKKLTGADYLLTTAVGASKRFVEHTEMGLAQSYLDYVNLMTYDFKEGHDSLSGHHTNLYASADDPRKRSADSTVKLFLQAGVPARKLVMGIAFYGYGWRMKSDDNKGLYRGSIGAYRGGGGSFTYLKDSLIDRQGFVRYWDKKAKAPYLFQEENKLFISYDDEASVKEKCKYVEQYKMGGVMFWEYADDKKGYLLKVINDELK